MPIGGYPTNFPQGFTNGINVRGIPLLQAQPGNVYYLDNAPVLPKYSAAGSNNNRGTYQRPFATLQGALAACLPNNGDIILVGPGHAETISSATAAILACSGVAVIGMGAGNLRPTFTFSTASTANIPVYGANISLQNLLFIGNFLSIASVFTASVSSFTGVIVGTTLATSAVTGSIYPGATIAGTGVTAGTVILAQLSGTTNGAGTYLVSVNANVASASMTTSPTDFAIDNCEFRDTSSVLGFLSIFTTSATANASDGFQMTRCTWGSLSTVSPTVAIATTVGNDRWVLADNVMNSPITATTQGPILMAAGSANYTNITIARNRCQRPNTSSSLPCGISTSGTAWSGHAYDNYFGAVPTGTGIWINTGTKLSFTNNYSQITGAADKSALINPSAV
jgi:hypothetical protein